MKVLLNPQELVGHKRNCRNGTRTILNQHQTPVGVESRERILENFQMLLAIETTSKGSTRGYWRIFLECISGIATTSSYQISRQAGLLATAQRPSLISNEMLISCGGHSR